MRVFAGSLKGRRLEAPSWEGLRPTSDKLRETLFNILAPRIGGAVVADVYAGTGAVGIEALSRGASRVVFIEQDRRAQQLVATNLAQCGIADGYAIVGSDALRALKRASGAAVAPALFDIIVADPPYTIDRDTLTRVLSAAGQRLAAGGVLALEHARRTAPPDAPGRLMRVRTVNSGDSALSFYEVRG
jgi:16S rRNA (guanine966-N2)-methyltransferase